MFRKRLVSFKSIYVYIYICRRNFKSLNFFTSDITKFFSENYVNFYYTDFTDTQKVKWLLVSAPMPVIFISIAYFYIVYIAGPQFMKNRQPYSLKPFMQCYNLLQIISNAWIVFNFVTYGRPFTAIWRFCESLDELCGNYSEKVCVKLLNCQK